jgi:uncharacterized repeat protein (TIGR02543 family)
MKIKFLFLFLCASVFGWGQVTTLVEWNFPNNPDDAIADGGISANLTKQISVQRISGNLPTLTFGASGATTWAATATGWEGGSANKWWEISFSTNGYHNIKLSSKQRSSNTGPRNFKLQYKLGSLGTWIDVVGGTVITAANYTNGVLNNFSLPVATENENLVFIRWIMTNNTSVNNGTVASTGTSNIDDILITGEPNCTTPNDSFTSSTVTKFLGDSNFTNTFTTNSTGTVSFSSSNTGVATINSSTGEVTIVGVGTTTITAATTANGSYCASTESYTLTVNPNSHTITYNGNGNNGGNPPVDLLSPYAINALVTVLGNSGGLTKVCSEFIGWNTAANGSGTPYTEGANFTINSDVTLYAQWSSISHTVSFNNNGGTGTMSPQSACANTALSSNTFTRVGYTFSGWNTLANGTGTSYANNAIYDFSANITLFAQWTPNQYTITFSGNGQTSGDPSVPSVTGDFGSSVILAGNGTLEKTGYTFAGWALNAAGTGTIYPANSSYTITTASNLTLFAKWTPNTYQVIFNGNGSDGGSMANQNYPFGSTANLNNNTYSRTGYVFLNWNTAADGSGTNFNNGASFTMSSPSNVTLYAQWQVYTPPVPKRYDLVTSESQLVAGKKYLIVNSKIDGTRKSLSRQNGNNRYGIDVTVSNSKIFTFPAINSSDDLPFEIILGGIPGAWTLADNITMASGYLYATYGQNYLRTQINSTDWTISIDTNGDTTIKQVVNSGSNSQDKFIKQNSSSSTIFSSYTTGQNNVYLFVENNCISPEDPEGIIEGDDLVCNSTILSYNGSDKANAYWVSTPLGQQTDKPATSDLNVTESGTFYIRIKVGECWSDGTISKTVVVNSEPEIIVQPTNQTINAPNAATFSVTATGGDLTYQWYISEDCGDFWTPIPGATNHSYTITPTTTSMNGNRFKVVVSNNCGSIESDFAVLQIVNLSTCIYTNAFPSSDGWTAANYAQTSPWTKLVLGQIWSGAGINITVGTRAQLRDLNTWLELPSINNPNQLTFTASSSSAGTGGIANIKIQIYIDNNWSNIATFNLLGIETKLIDLSSYSHLSGVRLRIFKDITDATAFISMIEVKCKTLPTESTDYTWTGNANTNNWDDYCNWSPKGIPTEVDNIRFRYETGSTNSLIIDDARTVNNIILDEQGIFNVASTGSFTINGNITYDGSNGATANFDCASTFNIASTTSVNIPPLEYGNLNVVGGNRNFPSETVKICSTLTADKETYTYNLSNGTIEYNGGNQIVSSDIEYYNLKITGSGIKTTAHGDVIVNGMTSIKSANASLRVPRPGNIPDIDPIPLGTTPNVLYALGGIDNTNGTTGQFILSSDANLIQHTSTRNDADNTHAKITVERFVQDMDANYPTDSNPLWDYVYWSSPVENHPLRSFSPGTNPNRFYEYRESNNLFYNAPENEFFNAKGYAIRAEEGLGITYQKTYKFEGKPNNASSISSPLLLKANNGYNLVGNPFPSNIDLDELFEDNSTHIHSIAYFWTNNTPTYYQSGANYVSNSYAIYNSTGGVPATANAIANPESNFNITAIPNGFAKVGQGFIVKAKTHNQASLIFNHDIRKPNNDTFFQKGSKNRFWISLTSPAQMVNTLLIGYIPGATNDLDNDFDASLMTVGSDAIYSILGNKKLAIQGRDANFQNTDVIPLGVKIFEDGRYIIDLTQFEGLFEDQNIYLNDKYSRKIHDLKTGPYVFRTGSGTFADRFEIIFKRRHISISSTLTLHSASEGLTITKENSNVMIKSTGDKIKDVVIYNLIGKPIYQNKSVNNTQLSIPESSFEKQIIIVTVETETGDKISKKLLID